MADITYELTEEKSLVKAKGEITEEDLNAWKKENFKDLNIKTNASLTIASSYDQLNEENIGQYNLNSYQGLLVGKIGSQKTSEIGPHAASIKNNTDKQLNIVLIKGKFAICN